MRDRTINIDIVQSNTKHVYIKLPFMGIPVKMNHEYFQNRIENGYFKVKKRSMKKMLEISAV